ncbi:hypothetical protein ACQP2P_16305 [Dactylosporangium sp. CA-139114]|uniref:hypothetical protein n=1 Tax=Dactylosporangium sp. CA-139114 TaxID=3239931 RepID=UPI003D9979BE
MGDADRRGGANRGVLAEAEGTGEVGQAAVAGDEGGEVVGFGGAQQGVRGRLLRLPYNVFDVGDARLQGAAGWPGAGQEREVQL